MNSEDLKLIIAEGEGLTVEFKEIKGLTNDNY